MAILTKCKQLGCLNFFYMMTEAIVSTEVAIYCQQMLWVTSLLGSGTCWSIMLRDIWDKKKIEWLETKNYESSLIVCAMVFKYTLFSNINTFFLMVLYYTWTKYAFFINNVAFDI